MATKVDLKFPGAEKHEISLDEAKKHIQRHKKKPLHPKHHGGSFDRAAVEKILAQPGCARLRIYHGRDEKGKPNLILVGVDAAGKDMLPEKEGTAKVNKAVTQASIMEKSWPCPPYCDGSSELLQ
jgi:hypothetical protein